jgi:hypothetical protein
MADLEVSDHTSWAMCATSSRGLNGGIIVTHVRAVTVLLSGESSKLRFSLTYTDLDYTCEVGREHSFKYKY